MAEGSNPDAKIRVCNTRLPSYDYSAAITRKVCIAGWVW